MGYIEENLVTGESIVMKARLHWGPFVTPVIVVLLSLLVLLTAQATQTEQSRGGSCIGGILLFAAGLSLLNVLMTWLTTEFAVTNKRIIAKAGWIKRRSLELPLSKVESIGVKQDLTGRIYNYGTIVVSGTGGTREGFPNIRKPQEFRKLINEQINQIGSPG